MTDNFPVSAINPFGLIMSLGSSDLGDLVYYKIVKDWFLYYYIGISDFRGRGKLVDKGLPRKIERQLSLKGRVLVLEIADELLLAEIHHLTKSLIGGRIVDLSFSLIGDSRGERYSVRELPIDIDKWDSKKKLFVFKRDGREDLSIDPERMVVFYNNDEFKRDLIGVDWWLKESRSFLNKIFYDAEKCRKKMAIFSPGRLSPKDWEYAINGFESSDYIVNIAFEETINSKGKKGRIDPTDISHDTIGPEKSTEREQLWRDYLRFLAEMYKYYGIQFNIGWKEERQNVAEIALIETPYRAWERQRKQNREDGYRGCEKLGWIEPGWELVYGGNAETNQQKIQKLEEEIKIIELEKILELLRQEKKTKNKEKETEVLDRKYEKT